MKKFAIQGIFLLVVIFGSLILIRNPQYVTPILGTDPGGPATNSSAQVRIKNKVINVEVADDKNERARGLGNRDSLDKDSGMLFLFENVGKYRFWMKGLSFPLDFIWIRENRVVDILTNVQPPSPEQTDDMLPVFEPVTEIDAMLEVNAGFVRENNIQIGDTIEVIVPTP